METSGTLKLLKIYVSNTDKVEHAPLYEAVAFEAKRQEMAGVTVFKGIMGYGASSKLHSNKSWELVEKVPIVIEIADTAEKIEKFTEWLIPWIKVLPKGCLIVSQTVDVHLLKQGAQNPE